MLTVKDCVAMTEIVLLRYPGKEQELLKCIGFVFGTGADKKLKNLYWDNSVMTDKNIKSKVQTIIAPNDTKTDSKINHFKELIRLSYLFHGDDRLFQRLWKKIIEDTEELAKNNATFADELKILNQTYRYYANGKIPFFLKNKEPKP